MYLLQDTQMYNVTPQQYITFEWLLLSSHEITANHASHMLSCTE